MDALTPRQAKRSGLSKSALYRAAQDGRYDRIARGLYRPADAPAADWDWLEAASRRPDATTCLTSALAYYDLIDAIPDALDVAIPRGSRIPAGHSAIRWHLFARDSFAIGRETIQIPGTEQAIGIYSPERTIVDSFRLRGGTRLRVGARCAARVATTRRQARATHVAGQPTAPSQDPVAQRHRGPRVTRGEEVFRQLQKLARAEGLAEKKPSPTSEYVTRHALESFLARLTQTEHAEDFILKGGVLVGFYGVRRPTKDVDAEAISASVTPEHIETVVRDVADVETDDGLVFDLTSLSVQEIREGAEYPGLRMRVKAALGSQTVTLAWDISTGDPIVPAPKKIKIPRAIGEPIEMLGYAPENGRR